MKRQAEERNKNNPQVGGPRDYWLPADTNHYLGKVVRNALVEQVPVRIRVHQVPRSSRLGWRECGGFPSKISSEHRLTICREVLSEDEGKLRLGPLGKHWDRWSDPKKGDGRKWTDCTVILKEPED